MKYFTILLIIFYSNNLFANEEIKNDWIFDRLNIYIENDKYFGTDDGYSTGSQVTALYHISKEDYSIFDILGYKGEKTYSYFTFSIANQIFTPTDFKESELIPDDRPYAGWTYLQASIHKATENELRSLTLQVGLVGPKSASEQIQNEFHRFICAETSKGWDNQLNDELGINLKYTQKWRYFSQISNDFESSVIPFASAELGNIAISATGGLMARIGWNIPKDYGVSSIDLGADPGIPVYGEYKNMKRKPWSLSFNFTAAASAIARDIFLDGNTFTSSHSVDKKYLVAHYGFGMTLRYNNIVVDAMAIETTKQFELQKKSHGVGSFVVSYLF